MADSSKSSLGDSITCAKCGQENPAWGAVCGQCGASLSLKNSKHSTSIREAKETHSVEKKKRRQQAGVVRNPTSRILAGLIVLCFFLVTLYYAYRAVVYMGSSTPVIIWGFSSWRLYKKFFG